LPTPASESLYDDLQELERSGLVARRSPVVVTGTGVERLRELEAELPEEVQEADAIVRELAIDSDLIERSIARAAETVVDAPPIEPEESEVTARTKA
jgi:glucose-6-phosphate-specific signal transduction histidine kinase